MDILGRAELTSRPSSLSWSSCISCALRAKRKSFRMRMEFYNHHDCQRIIILISSCGVYEVFWLYLFEKHYLIDLHPQLPQYIEMCVIIKLLYYFIKKNNVDIKDQKLLDSVMLNFKFYRGGITRFECNIRL